MVLSIERVAVGAVKTGSGLACTLLPEGPGPAPFLALVAGRPAGGNGMVVSSSTDRDLQHSRTAACMRLDAPAPLSRKRLRQ